MSSRDEIISAIRSADRFTYLRELGQGGSGSVHLAFDRSLGREVAVKGIRSRGRPDRVALRSEFRAATDLAHPNLVELLELTVVEEIPLLIMESVEGDYFGRNNVRLAGESTPSLGNAATISITHESRDGLAVTATSPLRAAHYIGDLHTLADQTLQLAEALNYLHANNVAHGDIKPSNVVVDRNGRVVVLDFGLAASTRTGTSPSDSDTSRGIIGTPAYAAPEQLRGEYGAPADWYAVGTILYEIICGYLPYLGSPVKTMYAKQSEAPPEFDATRFEVPDAWTDLVLRLLSSEETERPGYDEVAGVCRDTLCTTKAEPSSRRLRDEAFVGRGDDLGWLFKLRNSVESGGLRFAAVSGPSGVGKSALLRRYAELSGDVTFLAGRCHPRESVPYNGFDQVIDALAEVLTNSTPEVVQGWLPRNVHALARMFPSLLRSRVVARYAATGPTVASSAQRALGLEALRELLERISRSSPVTIWIDDLQWSQRDCQTVLEHLVAPPSAPAILVVVTYRSENAADSNLSSFMSTVARRVDIQHREIGGLSLDECAELAQHAAIDISADDARKIALRADGLPFFVRQLSARSGHEEDVGTVTLTEWLARRVLHLGNDARHLLTLVATARRPLPRRLLPRLLATSPALDRSVSGLRAQNLILLRVVEDVHCIEPAHDKVREAALEVADAADAADLHARLATTLAEDDSIEFGTIVFHWQSAGNPDKAAEAAIIAGDSAHEAFAFDAAAEFFRIALDSGSELVDRRVQQIKRARALSAAGRFLESAEQLLQANNGLPKRVGDDTVDDGQIVVLEVEAAVQFLRGGFWTRGLDLAERSLARLGERVPWSPLRARLSALSSRVQYVFSRRTHRNVTITPASPESAERNQLQQLWSAASAMQMTDHNVSDALTSRHLLRANRLGDPAQLSLSLGYQATALASLGLRPFRRTWSRLLADSTTLARTSGDAYAIALSYQWDAIVAWFECDWPRCVEKSKLCEARLAEVQWGTDWETAFVRLYRHSAQAFIGQLPELFEELPVLLRSAELRNDNFAANGCRIGEPAVAWLAAGDSEQAARCIQSARDTLSEDNFHIQHYHLLIATTRFALYEGRNRDALATITGGWAKLRAGNFLMLGAVACELYHLRGVAALGALGELPGGRTSVKEARRLQRIVRSSARAIRRRSVSLAEPHSRSLELGLALANGDVTHELFESTAFAYDRVGMRLYRDCTMVAARDHEARNRAIDSLKANGILNPRTFAGALVPLSP